MAALPECRMALALPPVHVATGPAYEALAASRSGVPPVSLPKLDAVVSWGDLLNGLAVNDFEATVAAAKYPPVALSLAALRGAGARTRDAVGEWRCRIVRALRRVLVLPRSRPAGSAPHCRGLSEWPVVSCATLTRMPDIDLE